MISKDLLKILACPDCKTVLKETGDSLLCTNPNCRRLYPVRNGIPVMLINESSILIHETFQTMIQS
jgi:uncharacterized protein